MHFERYDVHAVLEIFWSIRRKIGCCSHENFVSIALYSFTRKQRIFTSKKLRVVEDKEEENGKFQKKLCMTMENIKQPTKFEF